MLGQKFNDIIPPGLPAGTPVAHKTGWVQGVRNDAAPCHAYRMENAIFWSC
nr:serine hydrolase [Acetobacter malorum]